MKLTKEQTTAIIRAIVQEEVAANVRITRDVVGLVGLVRHVPAVRRNRRCIAGIVAEVSRRAEAHQIGSLCLNPSTPVTNGVTFVNPAPDCPSRLCMITPKTTQAPPRHSAVDRQMPSPAAAMAATVARAAMA